MWREGWQGDCGGGGVWEGIWVGWCGVYTVVVFYPCWKMDAVNDTGVFGICTGYRRHMTDLGGKRKKGKKHDIPTWGRITPKVHPNPCHPLASFPKHPCHLHVLP